MEHLEAARTLLHQSQFIGNTNQALSEVIAYIENLERTSREWERTSRTFHKLILRRVEVLEARLPPEPDASPPATTGLCQHPAANGYLLYVQLTGAVLECRTCGTLQLLEWK